MNSLSKSVLGLATIVGLGGGSFAAFDYQVRRSIDANIAGIHSTTPIILSMNYEDLDIDYIADKAVIRNSSIEFDMRNLVKNQLTPVSGEAAGKMVQNQPELIVNGVWDLIFGSDKIESISFTEGTFSADMTTKIPVTNENSAENQNVVISQHTTMSGSFGAGTILGLTLDTGSGNVPSNPFGLMLDHIDASDYDIHMSMSAKALDANSGEVVSGSKPRVGAINANIKIAQVSADDLSQQRVGSMRYEGVGFTLSKPGAKDEMFNATIDALGVSDVVMEDEMPIKMSYYIEAFQLDPDIIKEPKIKGLMAVFGVDELNFDFNVDYSYQKETRALSISSLSLGAKQAGQINFGIDIEGLPNSEFINEFTKIAEMRRDQPSEELVVREKVQQLFEKHFQELALSSLTLGYKDAGVLKKYLTMVAAQGAGGDMELMATGFAIQGLQFITLIYGQEKSDELLPVVSAFLKDPNEIEINLKSDAPVNLELLTTALKDKGPQTLKQFELTVKSGQEL